MKVTNANAGTNVEEIADGVYRINTPMDIIPGGFSFNQYLIMDDESLLFHTGPRKMFPLVREAVKSLISPASLRYISFSHVEADECGSLNEWLAVAPQAVPLCGNVAAMVSIEDMADRLPRALGDGETITLGRHAVQWLDAPHMPHAWECGFLFESHSRTLLCGDLFTQPGPGRPALTRDDILEPSEAFRRQMDYYSHTRNAADLIERLATTGPQRLACMHGSAWEGDGSALLRELGARLAG